MKKTIVYITSSARQLFYFGLPLLACLFILDKLKDLNIKQILLLCLLWVLYPRVKNFILGMKSAKHSPDCNFNNVVANELVRMQLKLNQLANDNHPCFETPKEMKYHPMTMNHFRRFVEYWQAYTSYPEIAACEFLDGYEEKKEKYALCLMTEDTPIQKDNIYLSNVAGKVTYSMIAVYDTPIYNRVTDIESPSEFTLDSLEKLKRDIIWFALRQGDLEISAIIILKKTDGIRYYDPIHNSDNISAQDLINLNSGGPLSYRKPSIKIGATLKAYVYDTENLGFLSPDQSEIKIISVKKDPYSGERATTFTIEIQPISGEHCFPYDGEKRGNSVIKTIKYADL